MKRSPTYWKRLQRPPSETAAGYMRVRAKQAGEPSGISKRSREILDRTRAAMAGRRAVP